MHCPGDASDANLSLGLQVVTLVRFLSPFLAREKDTTLTHSLHRCSTQCFLDLSKLGALPHRTVEGHEREKRGFHEYMASGT